VRRPSPRLQLAGTELDALGGVERLMRQIAKRISFGMGVPARTRVDHAAPPVLLEGVQSDEADGALHSTVHGAGRVMSRTRPPAGCGAVSAGHAATATATACSKSTALARTTRRRSAVSAPITPTRLNEVWIEEQVKPGMVDWLAVQARLHEQGIVLVGGGADAAGRDIYDPYKD
jgi:hypothetical protein